MLYFNWCSVLVLSALIPLRKSMSRLLILGGTASCTDFYLKGLCFSLHRTLECHTSWALTLFLILLLEFLFQPQLPSLLSLTPQSDKSYRLHPPCVYTHTHLLCAKNNPLLVAILSVRGGGGKRCDWWWEVKREVWCREEEKEKDEAFMSRLSFT